MTIVYDCLFIVKEKQQKNHEYLTTPKVIDRHNQLCVRYHVTNAQFKDIIPVMENFKLALNTSSTHL